MSWHGREAHSGPVPVDDTGGPDQLLDAYFEAASGAISRNTKRALRADVNVFHHLVPRPPHGAVPGKPRDAGRLHRRDDQHQNAGHGPGDTCRASPRCRRGSARGARSRTPGVRFALQRMHRRRGRRQTQVHGLTWPLRNRLLEAAGDRLIDARNRALLGVGYDTLLRRSELVALRVEDLLKERDGSATVLLRAGKTDAEGRGTALFLARDTVELVNAWRQRGRVGDGRLFRGIGRHGRLHERLDASQVPRIYKQMARQSGTTRRDRRGTGRPQHTGGRGARHDRLRDRAARDPPVRPLEDHTHGPALRRTPAGQTQRRRPARRTPGTVTLSRAFKTPIGRGTEPRGRGARAEKCSSVRRLRRQRDSSATGVESGGQAR